MVYRQYVKNDENHDNLMENLTVQDIDLPPTVNIQGGYYFYILFTGMSIHQTHWTKLTIDAEAKYQVHAFMRRENASQGLTFTESHVNDLDDIFPDADNKST